MPLVRAELKRKHYQLRNVLKHDISQVLYLPFDYDDGNYARDRSGHANHGTIYGATRVAGKIGDALSFDGVNDYVNKPSLTGLNRSALTFTFWSKQLGTKSAYMHLIGIFGGLRATVFVDPNSFLYYYWFSSINDAGYGGTIATLDDQWHFIAVTFDGAQIKAYLDGVLKATRSAQGSITGGDESLFVGTQGADSTPAATYFYGLIDEVRIYNRALSQAEIQRIMNMRGL